MILRRLFRLSSVVQSAISVHLRRNIGVTAVAFKELDPIQKLFVDKIREYRTKRQTSGGPVDIGPEYQQDLERELFKLKQMYGKAAAAAFRRPFPPRKRNRIVCPLSRTSTLSVSRGTDGPWGEGPVGRRSTLGLETGPGKLPSGPALHELEQREAVRVRGQRGRGLGPGVGPRTRPEGAGGRSAFGRARWLGWRIY